MAAGGVSLREKKRRSEEEGKLRNNKEGKSEEGGIRGNSKKESNRRVRRKRINIG